MMLKEHEKDASVYIQNHNEDSTESNKINTGSQAAPDGGYGWVIVFAAFMMNFIAFGILTTTGIMYVEFLEDLNTGKSQTSWISSIAFGTLMISSPISSFMCNRYGSRVTSITGSVIAATGYITSSFATNIYFLYISMGVVSGLGMGLAFIPFVVSVGIYFDKRKSFAMGIAVCGVGVGTLVCAPMVERLLLEYGWRGTSLIIGGIILNIVLVGALLRPLRSSRLISGKTRYLNKKQLRKRLVMENRTKVKQSWKNEDSAIPKELVKEFDSTKDESNSLIQENICLYENHIEITHSASKNPCQKLRRAILNSYDFTVFKNPAFLVFVASCFFVVLGLNSPYIYLPDRSIEKGRTKSEAALFISVIGFSNIFGRVASGWLSDRPFVNRKCLYIVSVVISGIVTIASPLNDSVPYLVTYAAMYGIFSGVFNCLYIVLLMDIVKTDQVTDSVGITLWFQGIASFIGPPGVGMVYGLTGNYNVTFYAIGSVLVIGGLVMSFVPMSS